MEENEGISISSRGKSNLERIAYFPKEYHMGFHGTGKTVRIFNKNVRKRPPGILRRASKCVFHTGSILRNPGNPLGR